MAEQPVPQQEGQGAPASQTPALTSAEIQSLIAAEARKQAQELFDARMPGMQSVYEKQLATLRKDVEEARRANLSEEELISSDQSRLEQELAQARREADALRAGRQYPESYPVFEAMSAAKTVEEQLEILRDALVKDASGTIPAPAQSADAPSSDQSPPQSSGTDPNRPLTPPSTYVGDGSNMDASLADQILGTLDRWPSR